MEFAPFGQDIIPPTAEKYSLAENPINNYQLEKGIEAFNLIKSFCRGSRCYTGRFSRKESPWPPEAELKERDFFGNIE